MLAEDSKDAVSRSRGGASVPALDVRENIWVMDGAFSRDSLRDPLGATPLVSAGMN
jgi:hypothetical protein